MNKKRSLLAVLIVLGLLAAISGCGIQQKQAATVSGDEQGKVRMIRDDLGREVQIPNQPKRVLALNSSMTEMIFDLGVVPVGKVNEYVIDRPEAKDLPDISFENTPNIEIINKLAPDLIIAHAKNHAQILESLEGTGAAVVCVDPSAAENQLIGRVDLIGKALNRQQEAAAYTKKVEEKSALLREKIATSPIKTGLFIQGGNQNITAAQSFCFWGRLLADLGIENIVPLKVSKSSKSGFVTFDIETIIQKDPDVILILQPGFRSGAGQGKAEGAAQGNKNTSPQELLAMYQNDPMWQQLSAVKNGHVFIVPSNVSPGKINVLDALAVQASPLSWQELPWGLFFLP